MQSILQKTEGSEEAAGLDGVTRLYGFTSFGLTDQPDIHVVVGLLPEHIYAKVNSTLRNSLIGLSIIGLVAHVDGMDQRRVDDCAAPTIARGRCHALA